MKSAAVLILLAFAAVAPANAVEVNPIEKILEMISDLQAKVMAEGEDAQKVYDEYAEFCEDRSKELGFEIKTGKANVKELEAAIADEAAKQASLNAKIEELSGAIATDEADLKA